MASREEEKRLRREEREKAEAAVAASQSRARRLQVLIGALLTIAVVVGVVLLVTGGDDKSGGGSTPTSAPENTATIPEAAERDLVKAAQAAECVIKDPAVAGSTHVEEPVEYATNPPTSGNHSATPALDGIYETGQEPEPENWVHSLEHGRINVMYKAGSPANLVSQLETLVSEPLNGKDGYKSLLFQNNTEMPFAVAAAAWGHFIGCKAPSDAMFDALRNFRTKYVDQGPEPGIPPTN